MVFATRQDAGRTLGAYLKDLKIQADLVFGLPRGGVVVAAEVASLLHLPLGVIVVRKIGHPRYREFAVGALAEPETLILDQTSIATTGVASAELEAVIAEEKQRLKEYRHKFEQDRAPALADRHLLLADDGLATGASMEAAVLAARKSGVRQLTVAVPVASEPAVLRIERVADRVLACFVDPDFDAVGRYYQQFPQTTDEEVIQLLNTSRSGRSGAV